MNVPTPALLANLSPRTVLDGLYDTARITRSPVRVYIDESNLHIGGQRHHAVGLGLAPSMPETYRIGQLPEWSLDYRALLEVLAPQPDLVTSADLFASHERGQTMPAALAAHHAGFAVTAFPRQRGTEKRVDVAMSVRIAEHVLTDDRPPLVIIGSGDCDYLPVVELAKRRGATVVVAAWTGTIAARLRLAADDYVRLDPFLRDLTHHPARPTG